MVKIQFVSHQNFCDICVSMLIYAAHPCLYALEGLLVRNVECNDHAVCLAIELVGDCLESLLTGRVPYFDVEFLIALLILSLDEVHAYCADVLACELGITVLLDD